MPIDRIELPKVSDCCSQCVRPGKTQLQVELDQDAGQILSRTSLSQRRSFFDRWLPRNNARVPCLAFASTYHMAEIKDICLAPPSGFRSNAENRGRMAYFGSRARARASRVVGFRLTYNRHTYAHPLKRNAIASIRVRNAPTPPARAHHRFESNRSQNGHAIATNRQTV